MLCDFSQSLLVNKYIEKVNNCIELFDGYNSSPKYGNGLIFILNLPLLGKSFGINLNVSDEGFVFSCGKIYQIRLSFPFRVNSKCSDNVFDSSTRNLILIFPFYNEDIDTQLTTEEEESMKTKKIITSTPKLSDNYLFDVL